MYKRPLCIRLTCFACLFTLCLPPSLGAPAKTHHKKEHVPFDYIPSLTDVHSSKLSADALQLAQQLHLESKLQEVVAVKKMRQANEPVPADRMERYRDFKDDIVEAIQQTRLEIDFAQAELTREEAIN